jgi:hypothetical protein
METIANKTAIETEKQLILIPINDYLEGRPVKDTERLRRAFHPDAWIRMVVEGKLAQWTVPQYLDAVAKAELLECQSEIISCTWDGDTASAHVQMTFSTFRFIDRFNLIKLDGRWLLMDKISFRQPL